MLKKMDIFTANFELIALVVLRLSPQILTHLLPLFLYPLKTLGTNGLSEFKRINLIN